MALREFWAAQTRLTASLRNKPCRGEGWWPMLTGETNGPRVNVCPRCGLEEADRTRPVHTDAPDT